MNDAPTATACHDTRANAEAAWSTLQRVRAAAPLVHSVTNLVVTNLTANMLLALGASPAMVENVEEAGALAAVAGAVVINLGSMSAPRTEAMHAAAAAAAAADVPWVLDPVAVGALTYRSQVARALLGHRPTAIRGNASEIVSLAGGDGGGHELQTRVTGMGCSATAVIAGCLAARGMADPVEVTAHALGLFGFAAERAARAAAGPASFQTALIDSLHGLTEPQVLAGVRIR